MSDQAEQFNVIIADYDKRVVEILNRVPRFLEEFDYKKSEAAQYLVNQMNLISMLKYITYNIKWRKREN
jgi:hypothetical protein